jgi:hypothetical protein
MRKDQSGADRLSDAALLLYEPPSGGENLTVTLSAFKRRLASKEPPVGLSPALAALWWAGKDEWNKAHEIVMNRDDPDCTWVHAYLHRVEGDLGNARYWYRHADRSPASGDLAAEWTAIAATLLADSAAEGA